MFGAMFPSGGGGGAGAVSSVNGKVGAVVLVPGDIAGFATVATSGAYADLTGKPVLATVATTGAYGDLSGTPVLATIATTGAITDATGTLLVGHGGSGAVTLTGYLKGNGAAAFTAAAAIPYADLTGTPTIPTAANPSALAGMSAVNGSASTFTRSDGAPAIDPAIAPTWTGVHTFTNAIGFALTAVQPRYTWNQTGAGTDGKLWDMTTLAGNFLFRTRTDADGAGVNVIQVQRTAASTAITAISFGDAVSNPAINFLGTGAVTFNGTVSAVNTATVGRIILSSTNPGGANQTGLGRPSVNVLGFVTNGTQVGQFDAGGQFAISLVGKGLSVKEGTNAKMGTAVLVGGTVVVNTTAVTATSRILLTAQVLGTVAVASALAVTARTAGTSFTITASAATDTSTIAWFIVEPS